MVSSNNTIANNTISHNYVGISFVSDSKFNIVHHNNIFDNTEFGINVTNNGAFKIDATNNWWGDTSGPYHSENNSRGRGDNVTDYVDFDPWIGKHEEINEDDEPNDDEPDRILFHLLILILLALFNTLIIAVHTYGLHFRKPGH